MAPCLPVANLALASLCFITEPGRHLCTPSMPLHMQCTLEQTQGSRRKGRTDTQPRQVRDPRPQQGLGSSHTGHKWSPTLGPFAQLAPNHPDVFFPDLQPHGPCSWVRADRPLGKSSCRQRGLRGVRPEALLPTELFFTLLPGRTSPADAGRFKPQETSLSTSHRELTARPPLLAESSAGQRGRCQTARTPRLPARGIGLDT